MGASHEARASPGGSLQPYPLQRLALVANTSENIKLKHRQHRTKIMSSNGKSYSLSHGTMEVQ